MQLKFKLLQATKSPSNFYNNNNNNNNNNRIGLYSINKKKSSCHMVDFSVPVDHLGKLKEIEKIDKYLYLERQLKTSGTWRCQWYQNWSVSYSPPNRVKTAGDI